MSSVGSFFKKKKKKGKKKKKLAFVIKEKEAEETEDVHAGAEQKGWEDRSAAETATPMLIGKELAELKQVDEESAAARRDARERLKLENAKKRFWKQRQKAAKKNENKAAEVQKVEEAKPKVWRVNRTKPGVAVPALDNKRAFPSLGGPANPWAARNQPEKAAPIATTSAGNCWSVLENDEVDLEEEDTGAGEYIAATEWDGPKPGFYFGQKDGKLGYHTDPYAAPLTEEEAAAAAAAVAEAAAAASEETPAAADDASAAKSEEPRPAEEAAAPGEPAPAPEPTAEDIAKAEEELAKTADTSRFKGKKKKKKKKKKKDKKKKKEAESGDAIDDAITAIAEA